MTMRAAYFMRHGGPEVLQVGDLPEPQPSMDQVVVDIHAASINGADWKVRKGLRRQVQAFPHILGRDFSGVVSAVGSAALDIGVGDQVFGVLPAGQEGTYAEKVAVKASLVARKPVQMPHIAAAAIALTGLTAIDAIEHCLDLKRGESIFISGGAGGVASIAIQIAKHLGAQVATTTSALNIAYVRSLGADRVIDYGQSDICALGPIFDCALDTVGDDVAYQCLKVVKPGGRAAFIASGEDAPRPPDPLVHAMRPTVLRDRAPLERIAELVMSGVVVIPEIRTYRLRDAARAHRISEGRHLAGKLVLDIRGQRRPRPRLRLLS